MRFSDSSHFDLPKSSKYANSDSSPFNSDEDSLPKAIMPPTTSNYDFTTPFSNDNSPNKLHDKPPFKKIVKTHQTDLPFDRLRHPSQNQSLLPHPPKNRTTNTQYNLRQQPKIDYRLSIPRSKL